MASLDSTPRVIEIPLTKGHVAIVDECDGDLADWKWHSYKPNKTSSIVYARRTQNENGCTTRLLLHRVILARALERQLARNEYVDHRNTDGLDNRRENLRLATQAQNLGNTRLRHNSKSGYKGVSYDSANNKWRAQLSVNGKNLSLGRYATPEEAYEVYCKAAKHYFGEFARVK